MAKGMLIIRNVGKRHRIFLILNRSYQCISSSKGGFVNDYRASDHGLVVRIQRAKDKIHYLFAINITVTIGKSINVFAVRD